MKVGKAHLYTMLVVLACVMAYNIWYFTQPSGATSPVQPQPSMAVEGAAPAVAAPSVAGEGAGTLIDPTEVPPPPDVGLDQPPQWVRNPFASTFEQPAPEVVPVEAPAEEEPDVVVSTILYSDARRLARVNGRIVREGDRVGPVTIVEIRPNAVVVESPRRGRRTMLLRPGGSATVSADRAQAGKEER
ncbi:MAG TPA: general secretion pathway protein GspB [Vicinamibacterales bacterium]|nr:general secretion pathway protein GspB [Vicinamibacterales bacterium]